MRRLCLLFGFLAACAAGDIGEGPEPGPDASVGEDPGDDDPGDDPGDDVIADADGDGVADSTDNCPALANANQADGDNDLIGDACDCDPADNEVAAYLLEADPLDGAAPMIAEADGFALDSWTTDTVLTQNRLADDASDLVFFDLAEPLANVRVELTAASTDITSFGDDDLRQLFIVARASSTADKYAADACGIEVVEGLTPTQKTSVVGQSGPPTAVASQPDQRIDRAAVVEGEELSIVMDVRDGAITCTVTLDGTDVTVAQGTTTLPAGAVGLFTRETRAQFRDVKICAY